MKRTSLLYKLLRFPVSWLTRVKAIADHHEEETSAPDHIVYVMRSPSATDLVVARNTCLELGLPDPTTPLILNGKAFDRVLYIEDPKKRLDKAPQDAFRELMAIHQQHKGYNVLMHPIGLFWGREPGREHNEGNTITADIEVPGKWKRFWLVMFSGRNILGRVSRPVSLRTMADSHSGDQDLAHKLTRVARTHFARLRYAVAGPKLLSREEMINELLKSSAIREAILEESRGKRISVQAAEKRARSYLNEIAADYREGLVRFGDHLFTWLWTKLYSGISVKNGETIRKLAQDGHEIVYMPCHRSHMDYLLLSFVIYKEGLVPPHIAAGVNLNFFPVGTLFRRGGAFFLRRSFRGNKLYSTVFREYLTRLFQKGYAVEYFMEGGRSRTGRLLPPKTGMLGMTLQSQLRGVTRPITFVPVYLGYEHVMEVNTYHGELKGQAKQKESVFQIFSMLRKLRNFGHGYVTFGEPLRLSDYLDRSQPQWRDAVTHGAEEPAKPRWMTPVVNHLADVMMKRVNDGAALNPINLAAISLLSAERRSLTREELVEQILAYKALQREVPYSKDIQIPSWSGEEMWQHLVSMEKFEINENQAGEVVSLTQTQAITLTYYRNNILHLFIVPALLARFARRGRKFALTDATAFIDKLFPMLQAELFINRDRQDVGLWVEALCEEFVRQHWITQVTDGEYQIVGREHAGYTQLTLLANASEELLARYAIVLELLQQSDSLSRSDLEKFSEQIAERLGARHGIDAPEFYDKRIFSTLVSVLKEERYITVAEDGSYVGDRGAAIMSDEVDVLLGSQVQRTIRESVKRLLQEREGNKADSGHSETSPERKD
ncbi:glycerol-3-phosphate 1-O-acyltransferase PlsB [Aliidiomarina sanyensis]|uniref:Glycerol-3-phosphate acyltransferase n=1 Tax=Aliidiomarina sanyensis TaxID=1249555 RepID=A0A432WPI2_9GAMM|nr:glycerol-3-phosphate 1-O-acyltransferase PlsB [Aliidiomarina sanyensis]RUO35648.1 glycerol-3-phosphate 1-O-acyltransferase [Aliidiomarina sanyensis]